MDSLLRRYFEDMHRNGMDGKTGNNITSHKVEGILHYYAPNNSVYLIDCDYRKMYLLPNNTEMTYLRPGCEEVTVHLECKASGTDGKPGWFLAGTCMSNGGMNGMVVTALLNIESAIRNNEVFDLGNEYSSFPIPKALELSKIYPYSQYREFSMLDGILGHFATGERENYIIYIMRILQDASIDEEILEMVMDLVNQAHCFWDEFYNYDDRRRSIKVFLSQLAYHVCPPEQKKPSAAQPKRIRYY